MEKIGLGVEELDSLFTQIKAGQQGLDATIYNAYLPLVKRVATTLQINEEIVYDVYNDVFSYLYNTIEKGAVSGKEFDISIKNLLAKQSLKANAMSSQSAVKESLSDRLIAREASRAAAARQKEQEIARESILYVVHLLDRIEHSPELAESYGLDEVHISMVRDFHGINKTNTSLNIHQIAEKYNVSESRAQAMVVAGRKKIREMQEFKDIKKAVQY